MEKTRGISPLEKNRSRMKRNFQTFGETLFGNFGISVIAKLHDEKDGINKQRLYAIYELICRNLVALP
jgi:hypothetical protein